LSPQSGQCQTMCPDVWVEFGDDLAAAPSVRRTATKGAHSCASSLLGDDR
jgi:hypothetical protein